MTTELKTLKDFDVFGFNEVGFNCISKEQLRAEAVKLVHSKGHCKHFPNCNKKCVKIDINDWINFFNLTEEDLK